MTPALILSPLSPEVVNAVLEEARSTRGKPRAFECMAHLWLHVVLQHGYPPAVAAMRDQKAHKAVARQWTALLERVLPFAYLADQAVPIAQKALRLYQQAIEERAKTLGGMQPSLLVPDHG